MNEKDLLRALRDVNAKYTVEAQARASAAQMPKRWYRPIIFAAGAAAVLGLAAFAYLPQRENGITVASENVSEQLAAESTATDPAVPAVTEEAESTASQVKPITTESASVATTAVQTAVLTTLTMPEVEQAFQPIPDTASTEPLPESQTEIAEECEQCEQYLPGDVDMDGSITYADFALALLDASLGNNGFSERSPLTPEQVSLADITDETSNFIVFNRDTNTEERSEYAVSAHELEIIESVAWLRLFYDNPELTTTDYLTDEAYYRQLRNEKPDSDSYQTILQKRTELLRTVNLYAEWCANHSIECYETVENADGTRSNVPVHIPTWDETSALIEEARTWKLQ